MYSLFILAGVATLCTLHSIATGHDTEPRCSKFHYDEQLLEKMVRMEHSSNLMMEEFRALKTQVSSDLDSVKIEKENMKTVLQEEYERIRTAMATETDKNRQILEELKGKMAKTSYVFSAFWLSSNTLATKNAAVVFSKTLFDEKEAYDNTTGKYTVPVSGTYMFTSQLCINSGNYAAVNFVADGSRIGAFDTGDKDYHSCSSGTALAKLQEGQQVWIKVTVTETSVRNSDDYGGFNYFAGHLIGEI